MALAGAVVADNEDALVIRRFQKLKIREDEIGQLVGHPVRDDERLNELTCFLGRFRLLELDDGLDRLEFDKFPILHGESHLSVMPVRVERDHQGFDLLVLNELRMARLSVGQGAVLVRPVPGCHKGLIPAGSQKEP